MEYENGTDLSTGATTDNLPQGVLYRVKATYKYNREDVDELSFDVGEIICVVEYEDPEEQVRISNCTIFPISRSIDHSIFKCTVDFRVSKIPQRFQLIQRFHEDLKGFTNISDFTKAWSSDFKSDQPLAIYLTFYDM